MTAIRVLRVITRLNIGGPALHVAILTERLDPTRFQTRLVAGSEGPMEGDMVSLGRLSSGMPVVRVKTLVREVSPLDDARALLDLVRLARAFRPHVVHTHLAKAGLLGRIAGRLAGARVIVHTYHGTVFSGYFGRRASQVYIAIERALAHITTRLVAITPQQRAELVRLGIAPPHKIVEIPLGLDLDAFAVSRDRATARLALGVPGGAPVLGLVGRLVPIKDVATFLRAFALLRQRMPAARAIVVGDGPERGRLSALAGSLRLGDSCRFLGWRADVAEVYAAIDVLALTSLNEGTPVSVIEALAAGCPVVATSVGGVPDVVRDGESGLLVPPGEPVALAEALERLLSDERLRAQLGEAGRTSVRARYDAARLVHDIEDLYSGLLSR